ncbi:MaoC/PaaZ C-terminal domain-containing protein [Peribacillus sp. SCS-37]|uniref:MaoC/PaaZ C-terminal domain-containing protein n=1 Tax=Paraperibacillus esterisolvens TaxID=3115296 RepID=UPI0039059170
MMTLEEFQVGDSLDDIQLDPVDRITLIKYAGASGDFNPIHTIDEEAKNAGLPGIIAHGMWTMGNLSKLFTPFYEDGFIQDYQIRFRGMVFLNDQITLKAELKEKDSQKLSFLVKAVNQKGADVINGEVIYRRYED